MIGHLISSLKKRKRLTHENANPLEASLNPMPKPITHFRDEYFFLSNFFPLPKPMLYEGIAYPTSEHAYQASKMADNKGKNVIANARTAGETKVLARILPSRKDWEKTKLVTMEAILRIKFTEPKLRKLLIDTYPARLIESNHWGDTYWGMCDGVGQNHLGKLLMLIRIELM